MMNRFAVGTAKHVLKALAYGIVGASVVLLVVAVKYLNNQPDLKVWHEVRFKKEFKASGKVKSFDGYLALEDRLFEELEKKVFDRIEPEDQREINRFHRGSKSDPGRWPADWNRTFEWTAEKPVAGVLLLHGMSDSPYSLRGIGKVFHDRGATVIGLRLPGHGTAPSGLVTATWEDMAGATRLAMHHLREQVGGRPIYIVGYSNGGGLAVEYALSSMEDEDLPEAEGLILISPAIGVTPMAALAVWQGRLGWLLGLKKLAWTSVLLEYDPFKYNSFAVNAGHQVFRLTSEIHPRLRSAAARKEGRPFPRVLAFQSAVDATVSARELVKALFEGLPGANHELVVFDLNRVTKIKSALREDPGPHIEAMLDNVDLPFVLSVVGNENEDSERVVIRKRTPGEPEVVKVETEMEWPRGIYSLAHVALPFRGNDPLYGGDDPGESPGIQIGTVALRGERGVLRISAADMLRLRWNPFYGYLEERALEFAGFGEAGE